jgi:hypothetical protein
VQSLPFATEDASHWLGTHKNAVPAQVPAPLQASLRVSARPSSQAVPASLYVLVHVLPFGVELDSQAFGVQL